MVEPRRCPEEIRRGSCEKRLEEDKLSEVSIRDLHSELAVTVQEAADAVSAYTQVENGRCSQKIENSEIGVSRHLDSSTTTQMVQIKVQYGRPSCSS